MLLWLSLLRSESSPAYEETGYLCISVTLQSVGLRDEYDISKKDMKPGNKLLLM